MRAIGASMLSFCCCVVPACGSIRTDALLCTHVNFYMFLPQACVSKEAPAGLPAVFAWSPEVSCWFLYGLLVVSSWSVGCRGRPCRSYCRGGQITLCSAIYAFYVGCAKSGEGMNTIQETPAEPQRITTCNIEPKGRCETTCSGQHT